MTKTKKIRALPPTKQFAIVDHISVAGIAANMGPLALHFYANAFLNAAHSLPALTGFDPVRPYLICHAIELGLKAFLSLQNLTMIELADSQYGHNFVRILEQAEPRGLTTTVPLTPEHLAAIRKASDYYSGKVFEYPAVGEMAAAYPNMPPINILVDAASILVQSLEHKCI